MIERLDAVGDDEGRYDDVRAAVAAETGDFQRALQLVQQAVKAA